MKKLERPEFLSKMFTWIITVFGFVFAIIVFLISEFEIVFFHKIIMVIIVLLLLFIIYLIIFTINLNRYCKRAEEKIFELEETKKTIVKESKEKTNVIFNLTNLVDDLSETINDFITLMETAMVNAKNEEEQHLKKIHNIYLEKREIINKKKGNN